MCYRSAFYSSLDLSSLLRESILMSRTPCHAPSPPPSLYWKLLFLHPLVSNLPSNTQLVISWICQKLQSMPATSVPSISSSPLSLRDLDAPVFPLSMSSSPLPSLSVLGTSESADFLSSVVVGEKGRQLHIAVQGVTPLAWELEWEHMRRAVLGVCSLALFVPPPTHGDVHPEASDAFQYAHLIVLPQYSPLHILPLLPLSTELVYFQNFITSELVVLMEILDRPETKNAVKLPLLIIYSSELEERFLAFWYRSRAGESQLVHSRISSVL